MSEKNGKIVFIAKTNLNHDGRILNQLKILQEKYKNIHIDFILLPDKPLQIDVGNNITVHTIHTLVRNSRFWRFLTVFEFAFKALILLFKLKPQVLHVQNTSAVLAPLIYCLFKGRSITLIYDDHEMPYGNQNFEDRLYDYFEILLMKRANYVIFANKERMEILKKKHNLKNNCSYFLNLPYFEENNLKVDNSSKRQLAEIDELKNRNTKFIIHQGVITEDRGKEKLANFSRKLPADFKILLLGGNVLAFNEFIQQYSLDKNVFHFVGSVNYFILPKFWERGIGSIVMYMPKYSNNRFCAPNRLYMSVEKGLPVIVNKANPVLSDFIKKYDCGFFIEEFEKKGFSLLQEKQIPEDIFDNLRREQIESFLKVYSDTLNNDRQDRFSIGKGAYSKS